MAPTDTSTAVTDRGRGASPGPLATEDVPA
jgi:hypothetical protein